MDALPSEILDTIIDWVSIIFDGERDWDRRALLCRCSSVCRAWLPRARYHLFRRRMANPTFMNLLATDGCTFAPHVRELRLLWHAGFPDAKLHGHDAALLKRLTGVNALELFLRNVPEAALPGARFHNAFLAPFVYVTHLEIRGVFPGDDGFVAETIAMFPLLTWLVVSTSHTHTGAPAAGASQSQSPLVAPETLQILSTSGSFGIARVLSGFHDSGGLRNIHSLELTGIGPESVPVVATAFQALAGPFRHLRISLGATNPDDIDLSSLVNLQSFRMDLTPWATAAPYERYLACVSRLSSPSLEAFSCRVPARGLRLLDWRELDAFLVSERFPCLKRFYWDLYGAYERDNKYVLDNLPRFVLLPSHI
ncbi:hypothetical protein FB451DRAFT_1224579 [Mycena latifolia]|nr:hypothetical protein FB451DRAFT_1224579 [Mycena latifolia]